MHTELDVLGVVLTVRGPTVELSVWPCSRIEANPGQLRHLTSGDACPRSCGDIKGGMEALVAGNRCRPRARDGRCHWCDRELQGDDLVGPKTATLWKERTIVVKGFGEIVIAGGEARHASDVIAKATAGGGWRLVGKAVGSLAPLLKLRLIDAIRRAAGGTDV